MYLDTEAEWNRGVRECYGKVRNASPLGHAPDLQQRQTERSQKLRITWLEKIKSEFLSHSSVSTIGLFSGTPRIHTPNGIISTPNHKYLNHL